MIDSITAKPIMGQGAQVAPTAPVATTAPVTVPATPAKALRVDVAQAGGLARSLAATAPVDSDRVATIKKAIADGRFPILPATIADRFIALKLQWNPNDSADDDQA